MFGRKVELTPSERLGAALSALQATRDAVFEAADALNNEREELEARQQRVARNANRANAVAANLDKLLGS